jgi:hypothetical protein
MAMRFPVPLQALSSFSAWHRLEQQELGHNANRYETEGTESEMAVEMKQFCLPRRKMIWALLGKDWGTY